MLNGLPNALTVSRMAAVPVVVGGLLVGGDLGDRIALVVFTFAGITDFFDGYIARTWAGQSSFGRILDPIADKLLVAGALLVLVGIDRIGGLDILPAVVILCREILVSGLREFLAELKVGVPVSRLAKWKTALQMLAIGILVAGGSVPGLPAAGTAAVGLYGLWVAAGLTLLTGLDYLVVGVRHMRGLDAAGISATDPRQRTVARAAAGATRNVR